MTFLTFHIFVVIYTLRQNVNISRHFIYNVVCTANYPIITRSDGFSSDVRLVNWSVSALLPTANVIIFTFLYIITNSFSHAPSSPDLVTFLLLNVENTLVSSEPTLKMVRVWLLTEEKSLTPRYITLEELYKTSGVEYYQVSCK